MTGNWAAVLDEILPEPGIDLGILRDPDALEHAARKAMRHARARLNAPTDDLRLVLDVLFAEPLAYDRPVKQAHA